MAVPHPEEVLKRVARLGKQGLPAVTVIMGSNDFFRREALDLLLASVGEEADLRVIDAQELRPARGGSDDDDAEDDAPATSAGEVGIGDCPELLDLRGGGLFAKRAFLCVRRAKNWWGKFATTLVEQADTFGDGCGVILEAPKFEKRKRAVSAFLKHWTEKGSVFEFRDLWEMPYDRARGPLEGELCGWVETRAKRLGIPLTPEAAWTIVARVSKQPGELVAELHRLRDVLGSDKNRPALRPDDLKAHLNIGFESTPFEFAEAVLAGDRRAAQRSLTAMFARGVKSRDGSKMEAGGLFPFASSWLYQQLAQTYEGRVMLDGGVSSRDLAGRMGVRAFQERFVAGVKKNDLAQLRRGLLALHHGQRMIRMQGEDPEIVLERFLSHWFEGTPVPTSKDLEL